MKIFTAISLILAVSAVVAQESEEDRIFNDYLDRFKIRLGRSSNVEKAKKNVINKLREVQEQNEKFAKGEDTFTAELNELSYKDLDQIARENLGFINPPPSNESRGPPIRVKREALPEYFNWVDKGVVRPVQNQGSCGSCYAFAAIGAIESRACITKGQCSKLSEQEAMECTNLCKGGWDDWVYNYANSKGGCASSAYAYYPYKVSECTSASVRSRVTYTKTYSWYNLHNYGEYNIRYYLTQFGPMFLSFDVYENFYSYRSGIYGSASGRYLGGHAVLLVGYGTENGIPYWILKNSWGTGWGEKGYYRMKRGINLCNMETQRVSVPLVV